MAVHVDPGIFDSYYNGSCNGTFWPLFHSMPDRATFIAEHWRAYSAVNEKFAEKTVRVRRFVVMMDRPSLAIDREKFQLFIMFNI